MKEYVFDNKSMYIIGDIHGDFNIIKFVVKQKKIQDAIIIVAGDVGLGFNKMTYYQEQFKKINKLLKQKNVTVLLGRGNHDDKKYFDNELINFSNIKSIPDYSIIKVKNEWNENDFIALYVGGAISIDRIYRLQNENIIKYYYKLNHPDANDDEIKENTKKLYWPDEPPFFDIGKLDEIVKECVKLDCVVSHTCPSFAYPQDKFGIESWIKIDSDLEKDADEERNTMTNVYNYLKENGFRISRWVYGHFHKHHDEIFEDVKFTLLDCVQNKLDIIQVY